MLEINNAQVNNNYTLPERLGASQLKPSPEIYSMPYDAINRESTNSAVYASVLSKPTTGSTDLLCSHINSIENTPTSLIKKEPFYTNGLHAEFGILTGSPYMEAKPQTMLISVPFEITEDLTCYGLVSANYVKDMSSTNSTLLYSTSTKGQLVVKDFAADAVIHEADRMYQQIDATMEVYIAALGKRLNVNVPKSWMLTNASVKNTTVISEYIENNATDHTNIIYGFSELPNHHSFIKNYRDSKLPIFHYLINHPHAKINSTTYANIIVRDDCELFSIDHEGCLKNGRRTPHFTYEQINQFFPDPAHYERFKQMNLTGEVNGVFGAVTKEYNKKVSDIAEINIADFEFRKQHLISQYEKYHTAA